jgi:anaerobic selenocysteine-containing dehydrogenase
MSSKDRDLQQHEPASEGSSDETVGGGATPIRLGRREVLKLAAVGGVVAASSACDAIDPPGMPRRIPGRERVATTVCGACPSGCGISVRLVGDLAVAVFGQPGHPVNDGGLCPRGVAEIQNLYHPERLRGPLDRPERKGKGRPVEWRPAIARLANRLAGGPAVIGVGRVSTLETELVGRIANAIGATVVQVDLPFDDLPRDAMRRMLGTDDFVFDLRRSDCVLSLGADWLQAWPSPVEAQRAYAALRHKFQGRGRIITASPRLTITAGKGDQWVPVPSVDLTRFGLAVAHTLLSAPSGSVADRARALRETNPSFRAWCEAALQDRFAAAAVGRDLGLREGTIEDVAAEVSRRSRPVVVADRSRPDVQRTATALNVLLGAVDREGGLLRRPAPPWGRQGAAAPATRVFPVHAGRGAVLLYRANPIYVQPAGAGWGEGLRQASFACSAAEVADESCESADLLLPLSTPLESRHLVSGATADGQQFVSSGPPAVKPLYDSKEGPQLLIELAAALGASLPWDNYRQLFRERVSGLSDFDEQKGWLAWALPAVTEQPGTYELDVGSLVAAAAERSEHSPYPLVLQPQMSLAFLGALGAGLPYLRGLPGPEGSEPWQTVAVLSVETARELGIELGQQVWVESARGRIRAVARIREGLHPETVVVPMGLGRSALGWFAAGQGSNVIELLTTSRDGETDWTTTKVRVRRAS